MLFFHPTSLMRHQRRASPGFTLVEVMVALAVLVMAGAGVFVALARFQRNAMVNRAYTNANNVLRSVSEQALQRGWQDPASPLGILAVTVTDGGAYDETTDITERNADGSLRWRRWNFFTASDESAATVPIYQDMQSPATEIPAKLYRKVQRVPGSANRLWITFRIEFETAGEEFAQQHAVLRSVD